MKQIRKQVDFFFREFEEPVNVNGNTKKVLISNATTSLNYYDDKFIRSREELVCGTILQYEKEAWMIISQVDASNSFYRARMRRVDWVIQIYINGILQQFCCSGEDATIRLEETKIMTISADELQLLLPSTVQTEQIALGQRFLKFGAAWKITGFDKVKKGLICLYAKKDVFIDEDDRENEIADRWKYEEKHIYMLSFVGIENLSIRVGETNQLEVTVSDNGVPMEIPLEVGFTSSNLEIATVDSKGLITAVAVGTTTITGYLKEQKVVTASCEVEITEAPCEEYSLSLVYKSTNLYIGGNLKTYRAEIYLGSTLDASKKVVWSVTDNDGHNTDLATLVDKGENTCTMQAPYDMDAIGKKVILVATMVGDESITNQVVLNIAG